MDLIIEQLQLINENLQGIKQALGIGLGFTIGIGIIWIFRG